MSIGDPARLFYDAMPFCRTLSVEFVSATDGVVTARLEWAPERCTSGGVMHGGAMMALADSTGAMCALMALPEGASGTTTIDSKTNFFRAIRSGSVEAVSRPLHTGRSVVVVETELREGESRLAAKVTQSQLVLRS